MGEINSEERGEVTDACEGRFKHSRRRTDGA